LVFDSKVFDSAHETGFLGSCVQEMEVIPFFVQIKCELGKAYQVATAIADVMDKRHLLRLGAIQPTSAEPPLVVADVGRLQNELGFHPQHSLKAGLMETIKWWSECVNRSDGSKACSFKPTTDGAYVA
jgi:hypothetical protein